MFGHSVVARVSVDMLQRIAWNEAKMTLKGYWVPIVVPGEGYIRRLYPHDHILMYPGTEEDVRKINEPRTTSSSGVVSVPARKLTPGSIETSFLTQQVAREPLVK
jgi:hypothetical protein